MDKGKSEIERHIMKKVHTLRWFINRIGKRIYRKPLSCSCKECRRNYVDIGEIGITGKTHAHYLYDCQNEMGIEYYDKPTQEVNNVHPIGD